MSSLDFVTQQMLKIDGAIGSAVVDNQSGMALATAGTAYDMNVVAGSAIAIIRAFLSTSSNAGATEVDLEYVVGVYDHYLLMIRILTGDNSGLSMVLVLDRERSNQAMANFRLAQFAELITV